MSRCLPVHIDVGTNRKEYRECPKVTNRLLRCRHMTPLRLSQVTRLCHFHSHPSNDDCLLCCDVSFLLFSSLQVSSHPFCFSLFSSLFSFLLFSLQYMGLRQERDRSPAYGELIQEFFDACHDKYGRQVLMQVSLSYQ